MKLTLVLLLSFFLFSCTDTGKSPNAALTENKPGFLPDSSRQRLLKIIEGGWVNEAYIQVLKSLNSPMKALAFGLPHQQLSFDISDVKGDTLFNTGKGKYTMYGDRFDLFFYKQANGTVGMKIKDDSHHAPEMFLEYSIEENDTVLVLKTINRMDMNEYRFRNQFRKFPESDNVLYSPREYCVNENLFAGEWKTQGKLISFSADGKVGNFRNYKRYSVSTFDENAGSSPDKISFYNDTADVTFGFTIVQNHLRFYEMKISDTGYSRGKVVAELDRN